MTKASFPAVNRHCRGVDYQPPSSAEVKERSSALPLLPQWVFVACCRVTLIFNLYSRNAINGTINEKYL